jgi:hypothetical protein
MENHKLPVHLFHPAFSHFQNALSDPNVVLTADDHFKTHKYMSLSTELYESKPMRQDAILASLNEAIHFTLLGVVNADGTGADGSIITPTANNHNARAAFYELRNEIGTGGSDPAIQGSLSYRKAWVSDEVCCVLVTALD